MIISAIDKPVLMKDKNLSTEKPVFTLSQIDEFSIRSMYSKPISEIPIIFVALGDTSLKIVKNF